MCEGKGLAFWTEFACEEDLAPCWTNWLQHTVGLMHLAVQTLSGWSSPLRASSSWSLACFSCPGGCLESGGHYSSKKTAAGCSCVFTLWGGLDSPLLPREVKWHRPNSVMLFFLFSSGFLQLEVIDPDCSFTAYLFSKRKQEFPLFYRYILLRRINLYVFMVIVFKLI